MNIDERTLQGIRVEILLKGADYIHRLRPDLSSAVTAHLAQKMANAAMEQISDGFPNRREQELTASEEAFLENF